jgi:DNA-binding ferritin-like protein
MPDTITQHTSTSEADTTANNGATSDQGATARNGATTAAESSADFDTPWRAPGTIEENPVGLDADTVQQLVPKLDAIQCTLWTLYHQYQKHHWLVEGPQFRDLHHFFEESYEEVHKYLDRVAERLTALGGIPTSEPAAIAERSLVTHEPEGAYRIRQMLEHDLAAERTLARALRETIQHARDLGDPGTERTVKKVLTKVEDRAHHLDHFLGEDSLEHGRPEGEAPAA